MHFKAFSSSDMWLETYFFQRNSSRQAWSAVTFEISVKAM